MRKTHQKVLAAAVAIIASVSLSACAGGTPSTTAGAPPAGTTAVAPPVTTSAAPETHTISGSSGITLRLTWSGDGQNKELLDNCLKAFTDKTGIGVNVIFINGGWADYFTKIQTMVAGGETIDVANVAIEGFQMLVDLGLATPMEDWAAKNKDKYDPIVADISPAVMQVMNFNGKQYGVPNEWNNVVTHINSKMLADAGLQLPPANWTKDQFLEYAKAMTKTRADGTKQYGVWPADYYFAMDAWLYNNGTTFMKDNFTKSNLLDPAVVEMFQFMQDLVYKYQYAPIPQAGMDAAQMLEDGTLGMYFAGRWPTGKYDADKFKDVTIQYIPNFKTNVPIWGGTGAFVMKDSKHNDEANQLALYLASPEFVRQWMGAGAIPVLNSVADELVPKLGIPQNYQIFKESAATAKAVEAPATYADVANLIQGAITDIITNKADVQTTLKAADAQLNVILAG